MLKGNIPILATAFHKDGSLDIESIQCLVTFLLNEGIDGLALFGNASEGYALTADEKKLIITTVRKMVGDLPLIVAAGGASPETAINDINQMHKLGADIVMVNPPSIVKPSPLDCYQFFKVVCEATDIDIMLQDAPLMTGVNIPAETIADICCDFSRVKYVKVEQPPTTIKIAALNTLIGNNATLFGGLNAGYLFEELERGCVGTMPACEFPDVINSILQSYSSGHKDKARETFYQYLPFLRYGVQPGLGVSIHKTVLQWGGIFSTAKVRNPAKSIDQETAEELASMLKVLPINVMNKD